MYRIAGAFLILFGVGWLASELPATVEPPPRQETVWRRTVTGWERADWLHPPAAPPALHPAIFGATILLLTLTAAVGFSPAPSARSRSRE